MKHRNKILIITAIVFVVTAIVFLITGFAVAGNDVIAWFGSKYAMLFYITFGMYGLFIVFILLGDKIRKI